MVVLFSVLSRNAPHTKRIKQQIRGKGLFVYYFLEVGRGASFLLCRSIKKAAKHLQISKFFSYFRGLFLCKEGV